MPILPGLQTKRRAYKYPLPVLILIQINPVRTLTALSTQQNFTCVQRNIE
jgi:hypothetical protein